MRYIVIPQHLQGTEFPDLQPISPHISPSVTPGSTIGELHIPGLNQPQTVSPVASALEMSPDECGTQLKATLLKSSDNILHFIFS